MAVGFFFMAGLEGVSAGTIYVAIRGDGVVGTGTQADPYDASTTNGVSKFDEVMRNVGADTVVNLAPGLYQTWGDDGVFDAPQWGLSNPGRGRGFFLKPGVKLIGSGIGKTVIRLIGLDVYPGSNTSRAVVASGEITKGPNANCRDNTVQDLTVDTNAPKIISSLTANSPLYYATGISISGVQVWGNNGWVKNVEVLNTCAWKIGSVEGWGISFGSSGVVASNLKVENSIVREFVGNYSGGFFGVAGNDSYAFHGSVKNCSVVGATWFAYGTAGRADALFQYDTAVGVGTGFYWDTGSIDQLSLVNNTLIVDAENETDSDENVIRFNAVNGHPLPVQVHNITMTANYFKQENSLRDLISLELPFVGFTPSPYIDFLADNFQFSYNTLISQYTVSEALHVRSALGSPIFTNISLVKNQLQGFTQSYAVEPGITPPSTGIPQVQNPTVTPPTVTLSPAGPFNVKVGETIHFTVTPVDSGAIGAKHLIGYNVPSNAVITGNGVSAPGYEGYVNSGSSVNFDWTPTMDQTGPRAISFLTTASADGLTTGFGVARVNVVANPAIVVAGWKNLNSAEVSDFPRGSRLQKVAGGNNATAIATAAQKIIGNGWMEFSFGKVNKAISVSFSVAGAPESILPLVVSAIPFGSSADVSIPSDEQGTNVPFGPADIFRVERFQYAAGNSCIRVYLNGVLQREIALESPELGPISVDVTGYDQGVYIDNCVFGNNAKETEPVSWTSLTNMTVNSSLPEGSWIQKTGSLGWNSMALGTKKIVGDGCVEFRFNQTNADMLVSLSRWNGSTNTQDQQFSIFAQVWDGKVHIVDYLNQNPVTVSYTNADLFRIERKGTTISYYKNNVLLYTSPNPEALPLVVNCAGNQVGAGVRDCTYSGATLFEPVAWAAGADVVVDNNLAQDMGSKVTSSAGATDWSAQTISTKRIIGDGSVQFQFGQQSADVNVSLSVTNTTSGYLTQYSIISQSGQIKLLEWPTREVCPPISFVPSDLFRMERRDGKVSFYKNGALIATSRNRDWRPMIVGFTAKQPSVYVTNCSYSGGAKYDEVAFTNSANTSISTLGQNLGSRVEKTSSGSNWDAMAFSNSKIVADGSVRFTFGQKDKNILVSLSAGTPSANPASQQYAFQAVQDVSNDKVVKIVDPSSPTNLTFYYFPTDTFEIKRVAGVISYYRNGALLYQSPVTSTLQLGVTVCAKDQGAAIDFCLASGM
jgi:hypothetical protein